MVNQNLSINICRNLLLVPAFFLIMCLINIESANAGKVKVYWGGVGFTGSWGDRDQLYPFSSRLLCVPANKCTGEPQRTVWGGNIDEVARNRLANKTFDNLEIELDLIEDDIEGTIMAIGITGEMLGITNIIIDKKEKFQHVFRIFGSLIFYEFYSGKVIKNIPIIVKYTTIRNAPVNDDNKFSIIKNIFTNNDLGINFFDVMYKKTKSIDLTILPSKYTQITEINLSKGVSDIMSKSLNVDNFENFIAQMLEAQFVSKSDAPLLPSLIGGYGVKQNLKATFSDAERELKLNEAAFEIGLDVRMFKKFEKKSGAGKTVCHAVAVTLHMEDNYEKTSLNNIMFSRTKDSCGIASNEQIFDPTFYFPESLFSLTQDIATQFSKEGPDNEWLKDNAKKSPDAMKQIIKSRELAFDSVW